MTVHVGSTPRFDDVSAKRLEKHTEIDIGALGIVELAMKLSDHRKPRSGAFRQRLLRALIGYPRDVKIEQRRHELEVVRDSVLQLRRTLFRAAARERVGFLSFCPQAINGDVQTVHQGNHQPGDEGEKRNGERLGEIDVQGSRRGKKEVPCRQAGQSGDQKRGPHAGKEAG